MKTNSVERLNKIYDKYDRYFSTYFGRNSYEDSTRHMDRFLSLMVTMAIRSKGDMHKKFIKRYGEVFDLASSRDKDELEKLIKEQTDSKKGTKVTKTNKQGNQPDNKKDDSKDDGSKDDGSKDKEEDVKLNESFVEKYKEVFIRNVGEFFKEDVIIHANGINAVQVERLNYLFDTVKGHLVEPSDKRDVYEAYLAEIDRIMNENYDGEAFEEWSELEIYLNIFEIKDELNDILLEMDDLTAEDVGEIMEGMEFDILRVLGDIVDSEDDMGDFEPLSSNKEDDPDDEPVTQLITEEEENENNIDDYEGFEGLGDDEVDLNINIDNDTDTQSDLDDIDDIEITEVTKNKSKDEKKDNKNSKEDNEQESEPEIESESNAESESEDIELVTNDDNQEDEDDNTLDALTGNGNKDDDEVVGSFEEEDSDFGYEYEEDEDEDGNIDLDSLDDEDDNYISDDNEFNGDDEEESVTDLDGILGDDEGKKKKKVVISDEETSKGLDKYL